MNLFASFVQGIADCFVPITFAAIILGSIVSTIVGIIPVLGGVLIVTLMIPFISGMDPKIAMPLLIALDAVSCTGGSMTAILMNVPGDSINTATMMDGYPMAQKGEGGRAIGAALVSSVFGGTLSVPLALIMIPVLIQLILQFRSPELFLMILIGICCIAVLTTKGREIESLMAAFMGILFSCIGSQGFSGASRFTFNYVYLYEGIPVALITLGLFALPALGNMLMSNRTISGEAAVTTKDDRIQMRRGARDVIEHKWLMLRSMIIGYFVGVLPAVGAQASTFMCYGMAKKSSKHPEEFGKGCVEGVIAPESANNAKHAGAMLTTLAFGIPGSVTSAILMSAMVVLGITPGPSMLTKNTTLCITMLTTIAIANIVAAVLCWIVGPYITQVTKIRPVHLFAAIVPIVMIGAYTKNQYPVHLIIVLIFGVLGMCFRKFHYSAPSFTLGFILGADLETFFWRCMTSYGDISFVVSSPICIVLLLICGLILFNGPLTELVKKLMKKDEPAAEISQG